MSRSMTLSRSGANPSGRLSSEDIQNHLLYGAGTCGTRARSKAQYLVALLLLLAVFCLVLYGRNAQPLDALQLSSALPSIVLLINGYR